MDVKSVSDRPNLIEFPDHPALTHLINTYFETLNNQDFDAAAALFAPCGILFPPFDTAMEGQEAITAYLKAEARGLQLFPQNCSVQPAESDGYECQVTGKVQTPIFAVNVGWKFQVNSNFQIESARIKLLASMEELLKLKG
ncbi:MULTISPECIES: ketosteroid isomerase family protein [unclassified Leptolyngbya]|uniref:ketosteroid isomerase family protein n=1 Tax=unclassified Leptolyngbya TaxID=2650499 RepID=UPI0016823543|nr:MULTISPECIES: ketosteroid isomerase family protein [unclassified Leptolyngbya]MBD1913711.1 DUF4440 domain-containing protein [Leptolyngbya sp. FACHB-8]MBD2155325.1 DUF4440 domain-containing protein [Leptolyngbya sp. FACHB-16]